MAVAETATIKAFLGRFEPKDKDTRRALNLSKAQAELFWAALSAVPEGTLEIPNMNRIANKFTKYGSPYVTKLGQKGVIERGEKWGDWKVTSKAIDTMNGLLSGKDVNIGRVKSVIKKRTSTPRPTTKRKYLRRKPSKKSLKEKINNMTVFEVLVRMNEIGNEMKTLEAEKSAILKRLRPLLKSS